jgi:hypothetical protein
VRVEFDGETQGFSEDGRTSDLAAVIGGLALRDDLDVTCTLFTVDTCGNLASSLDEETFNTGD